MRNDIKNKLRKLGLHEDWFLLGFADEVLIEKEYELAEQKQCFDEHARIRFYSKFFEDRQSSGFSDDDIEKYMRLISYELDSLLKGWAISFLVECQGLSREQLIRLTQHELIMNSEKHLYFLKRNIKSKDVGV